MDPFRAVDSGAYYFFRYLASQFPGVLHFMQGVNFLASYVAGGVVLLAALVVLCLRRRFRAALAALVVCTLAAPLVEFLTSAIARRRPDDAIDSLGAANMLGSYPARGVFLFTLPALLLAFALASGTPRRTRVLVTVITAVLILLVCLSQFFLGLHYVTDVLGALLGAGGCALLAWQLARPRSASIAMPRQETRSPGAVTGG